MIQWNKGGRLALAGVLGFAASLAIADPILYISQGGTTSNLYRVDVATETVDTVGLIGWQRVSGLDFDASGVLYGLSGGSSNPTTLITINTGTGAGTSVGETGWAGDGLAFRANGELYMTGWDGTGNLVQLDPSTGAALGSVAMSGSGNSHVAGLDFAGDGVLYGSRGNAGGSTEDLVTIDLVTGVHTAIGTDTITMSSLWFDDNGDLYGLANTGDLYQVDPFSGDKTFLFSTGIENASGMSGLRVVPEPASMAALALGLASLARRRRK